MRKEFYITFFIVGVLSCQPKSTIPENLISEERLIDVIVEMELAQSLNKVQVLEQDSIELNTLFENIYKEFEINQFQIDENLKYYSETPEKMEVIYEKVIEKLTEKQVEAQ